MPALVGPDDVARGPLDEADLHVLVIDRGG